MVVKEELIKRIEAIDMQDIICETILLKDTISTIKSFLKDYKLVKKGDLLTEKDMIILKKDFGLYVDKDNPEIHHQILKKLKALGGEE